MKPKPELLTQTYHSDIETDGAVMSSETKYVTLYRPQNDETIRQWEARAMQGTEVIGFVRLRQMRECVAIGVAFHLNVREDLRRQGVARGLMREIERTALLNGMTLILSTIRDDNPASAALVLSIGYALKDGFHNPKSGADVRLYTKGLA